MNKKRSHGGSSGDTPGKTSQKIPKKRGFAKKSLFSDARARALELKIR